MARAAGTTAARAFGFWQSLGLATGTRDDAGPIDFASLERRATPNDSLICPKGFCPRARADLEAPAFAISPDRLRETLRHIVLSEARTRELDAARDGLRFVQRSFLLRYPDVIDVVIAPRGNGGSTLALYSRSLVGRRDFNVNRRRLERWLAALAT